MYNGFSIIARQADMAKGGDVGKGEGGELSLKPRGGFELGELERTVVGWKVVLMVSMLV